MTPEIEAELKGLGFNKQDIGARDAQVWWDRRNPEMYITFWDTEKGSEDWAWSFIHRPEGHYSTERLATWEDVRTALIAALLTEQ